ncbi:MAG TPA: RNA polymerase sigma factor [Allosphingosinicella sp.]
MPVRAERDRESPGRAASVLRVARAQSGDRAALEALLRDHQQPLYRHVRTITGDPDLAFDVLQSVLLIVVRRLAGLRDPRWFRAWAYRIATREAVRAIRRRSRDLMLFDGATALDNVPDTTPEADPMLVRACADRLGALPPAAEITLRLHYLEEMSLVEIAEALEIPLGTVKSRLAYGLVRLREELGPVTA